jgi:hypothetical protein
MRVLRPLSMAVRCDAKSPPTERHYDGPRRGAAVVVTIGKDGTFTTAAAAPPLEQPFLEPPPLLSSYGRGRLAQ